MLPQRWQLLHRARGGGGSGESLLAPPNAGGWQLTQFVGPLCLRPSTNDRIAFARKPHLHLNLLETTAGQLNMLNPCTESWSSAPLTESLAVTATARAFAPGIAKLLSPGGLQAAWPESFRKPSTKFGLDGLGLCTWNDNHLPDFASHPDMAIGSGPHRHLRLRAGRVNMFVCYSVTCMS